MREEFNRCKTEELERADVDERGPQWGILLQ